MPACVCVWGLTANRRVKLMTAVCIACVKSKHDRPRATTANQKRTCLRCHPLAAGPAWPVRPLAARMDTVCAVGRIDDELQRKQPRAPGRMIRGIVTWRLSRTAREGGDPSVVWRTPRRRDDWQKMDATRCPGGPNKNRHTHTCTYIYTRKYTRQARIQRGKRAPLTILLRFKFVYLHTYIK